MLLLSIIPDNATQGTTILSGLLALILVSMVWGIRKYPHILSNKGIFLSLFLCLLFYIAPTGGSDYYGYKEVVEGAGFTNLAFIDQYTYHLELPYWAIINFVNNDYILFRTIVWGGSLLLFWVTAKRLNLDKSAFVFYLCIGVVPLSAVSRVCLAYAIACFGFSFIAKPITNRGKAISYIIGAVLIYISLFFHRSALFLVPAFAISILNFNKKTITLMAIFFPILVVLVNTSLFDFILGGSFSEDSLMDQTTAMQYLESDRMRNFGFGQLVDLGIKYASHIAMVVLVVRNILNNSYKHWPREIQKYANATLFITIFAAVFIFTTNATTYKVFERLIAFAYVPQAFFLAYMLKNDLDKKYVNIATLLIAGYVVYNNLYYGIYFGIATF